MKECSNDPQCQAIRLDRRQSARFDGFRDFERLLLAFGFELARIRGSHRLYTHKRASRALSVQPRGKDAKSYQIEQFVAMVAEFGLILDE